MSYQCQQDFLGSAKKEHKVFNKALFDKSWRKLKRYFKFKYTIVGFYSSVNPKKSNYSKTYFFLNKFITRKQMKWTEKNIL
jgi:hypothetical protein